MTNLTIWTQSRIKYFEKSSYTESDEQQSKPTLQMNSFNKRAPASEDKSPPLKFILNFLLHSSDLVFNIFI